MYKGSGFAQVEDGGSLMVDLMPSQGNQPGQTLANKDTVVVFLRCADSVNGPVEFIPLAGWDVVQATANGMCHACFVKTWRTGESASQNFSVRSVSNPGASVADVGILAVNLLFDGVTITQPINQSSINQAANTTQHTANSVNTDRDNCMLVVGWASTTSIGMSAAPSDMIDVGGFEGNLMVAYKQLGALGPTGNKTRNSFGAGNHIDITIALAPVLPPGPPSNVALNPVQPDTAAVVSFNKGVDPEEEPVVTKGDISTDGGLNYQPFFMSQADAVTADVNFSNVVATNNARLRLYSSTKNGVSGYVVFGPFTIVHPPSQPNILTPLAGSRRVKAIPFNITWDKSTSLTYPQSQLKYEVQLSSAGNVEAAFRVLGQTALNVNQFPYDFAQEPAGNNFYVRVVAIDPAGRRSTFDVEGPFTVAEDVAPGQPANPRATSDGGNVPNGGTFNRLSPLTVLADFNDEGDIMEAYEIRWGTDGLNFPNTTGIILSAQLAHVFAANLFPRQQIYFQLFTRDLNDKWNAQPGQLTLRAGERPNAPAFVYPLNNGQVNDSAVVAQWNSVGQEAFELMLLDQNNNQLWTSGVVVSAVTQYAVGVTLLNGRTYKLKLMIRNNEGLWSAASIVTFTVVFAQPPVPVIQVTPMHSEGFNQIQFDAGIGVVKLSLYRYIVANGIQTAERIKDDIAPGSVYEDKTAPGRVAVGYYARAYSNAGLFSDSDANPVIVTLNLRKVFLTIMDGTNRMFSFVNFDQSENIHLAGGIVQVDGINADGSAVLPVAIYMKRMTRSFSIQVIARKGTTDRKNLDTVFQAFAPICVRDGWGNKGFCSWHDFAAAYKASGQEVTIPVNYVRFIEDLNFQVV